MNCRAVWYAVVLLLSGCASAPYSSIEDVRFIGGNGESVAEAIVIKGVNDAAIGVSSEYYWLRENMPGWTVVGQGLVTKGRRAYDAMTVRSESGEERTIYFDISEFYGRF